MAEIDWKSRAIERRLDNKKLNKKCKELTISRDGWKDKALQRQAQLTKLTQQIAEIKKNIQKITDI